jgi:plasmid stability protein
MASITIRNLDDNLKMRLRLRAAQHSCSMEAEVRNILYQTLMPLPEEKDFFSLIRKRFEPVYADSLPIPARQKARNPPEME